MAKEYNIVGKIYEDDFDAQFYLFRIIPEFIY